MTYIYHLTRPEIKTILENHNLVLNSYKPNNTRLYAVFSKDESKNLTGFVTFAEIRAFVSGFDLGLDYGIQEAM